jgi:predicted small lipoprotein YifL
MTHQRAAAVLLAAAAALGGCGQKGPLYLPDSAGSVVTRPTQTPAPAAEPATATTTPANKPAADDKTAGKTTAPQPPRH